MSQPSIGALVIGQSPRPDLTDPIRNLLPTCTIIEQGALDELTQEELPPVAGVYPLVTRMRNGATVQVEEKFLLPRLHCGMRELERRGVAVSILLCAGTFTPVRGDNLIKPFNVGKQILRASAYKDVGFIAPVVAQEAAIAARWQKAGFRPKIWTAPLTADPTPHLTNLDCIVLDYVGHPAKQVAELQARCPIPVLDLGQLAIQELKKIINCE